MSRKTLLPALASLLVLASAAPFANPSFAQKPDGNTQPGGTSMDARHPYVGMWVTPDGQIRQELLPNGRYDEARGSRKSAYQGRYEVTGTTIKYWDDTGFTADGEFVSDDELHHGGMVFRRQR